MVCSRKSAIFAAEIVSEQFVSTTICILGLTGFDGEMKWYVSTRRLLGSLHNLNQEKFNWRNKVRSRCLIEVQ